MLAKVPATPTDQRGMSSPGPDATTAGTEPAEFAAVLAELAALLWTERELLERLQFKLLAHQLTLSRDGSRWIELAGAEVRSALARLQACEVARAACTDQLIRRHGLPSDTTLRELAAVAPEPWPAILGDHHAALRSLTVAVDRVVDETQRLVRAQIDADAS